MADYEKVCYVDGWHYSVVEGADGNDVPGERLVLEDDGTYRLAADDDTNSWHDRKHQQYVNVVMEDSSDGVRVTPSELAAINELLAQLRGI